MKKANDPDQLVLFDLTPLARETLRREKKPRWYYLASAMNDYMVVMGDEGHRATPMNLAHKCPWLTNSKQEAVRVKNTMPGFWKVKVYPYIRF